MTIIYLLDNIPSRDVYVEPDREYKPREISWKEFSDILVKKSDRIITSYLNEETTKALRNLLNNVIPEPEPGPISIDPHIARYILVARLHNDGSLEYFSLK